MTNALTEQRIIEELSLDHHAKQHPVPKVQTAALVVVLNGEEFSQAAVRAAVEAATAESLERVRALNAEVNGYNNMLGHAGAGGTVSFNSFSGIDQMPTCQASTWDVLSKVE